jgi:hypothetical protein
MLSSSLRSELAKERANALETVEQGVPRQLFKRLRPLLVDPGSVGDAAGDGAGGLPVEEVIEIALQSPFASEAAAAADAAWEEENPEILAKLRSRLSDLRGEIYRETAVRLAATGQDEMTPVDVMDHLSTAPFFRDLRIGDLEEIALCAEVTYLEPGTLLVEEGALADRSFVVAEGHAHRGDEILEAGALVGDEALGISDLYRSTVVSDGATVVCVPSRPVMDLANVSSALGIELIRLAAGAYGVPAL